MSKSTAEQIVNRLEKRRGRPSLGRTDQINFRATPEEREAVRRYAEENGLPIGEALRYAIKLLTEEGE